MLYKLAGWPAGRRQGWQVGGWGCKISIRAVAQADRPMNCADPTFFPYLPKHVELRHELHFKRSNGHGEIRLMNSLH